MMDDLISRQAAIDALDFEIVYMTAYYDGKNEGNPLAQYNKGLEDGKKAIEALPSAQPVATDTNVGDTISRKGVFIPNITVKMFRNASLEGVEDLMASGEMEDISLPSAQPEQKWIPCSERCPKENGYYLTTTINKEVYCDYWSYDHFDRTEAVVAWMRLPDPYREGDAK